MKHRLATFMWGVLISYVIFLIGIVAWNIITKRNRHVTTPTEIQTERLTNIAVTKYTPRFEVVESHRTEDSRMLIVYQDSKTGKQYLFVTDGNSGGLTELK